MKKVLLSTLGLLVFLLSCSKDDGGGNVPPNEVSNIEAKVVEGTIVRVSWDAAKDLNGDEVSYDIIINDRVVATKTKELSVNYDTSTLLGTNRTSLSNNKDESQQKGVSLELIIEVKSYDSNGGVSEGMKVSRYVFVNRAPGSFEFISIDFDVYSYNWIQISWAPASDEDGDILSYDIHLNDEIIAEDYVIGSNDYDGIGRLYYQDGFEDYVDEDITIKVVANDRDGGLTEIAQTFNFRATDIDLGALSTPYEDEISFIVEEQEPDNKLGYNFSVSEVTGYSFIIDTYNASINLRDENGYIINSGNPRINGVNLQPGLYYIEVIGYGSETIGNLSIVLRDPAETDESLGLLTVPESYNESFVISRNEPDNEIRYSFEIEGESDFSFSTSENLYLVLYNGNDNQLYSGYRSITGIDLPMGEYSLAIRGYYSTVEDITGSMNLNFEDYNATDQDLGNLSVPYSSTFNYTTINEADSRLRYNFSINTAANTEFEIISANYDTYLFLYDGNGTLIASNDDGGSGTLSRIVSQLSEGSYYIEVGGFGSARGNGTLEIIMQ